MKIHETYAIQVLMCLLDWVAHDPCQAIVQSSKRGEKSASTAKGKEQVMLAPMSAEESCSYASMRMPIRCNYCSHIS